MRIREVAPNLEHPHMDYLRLLYEGGIVALAVWLTLLMVLTVPLVRSARSRGGVVDADVYAALAIIIVIIVTALTDNSLVYQFVLMPFGLIVGWGLKAGRQKAPAADTPSRKSLVQ
jgi:O-antigen ligase